MSVTELSGRVLDVDGHEFVSALHWEEEFGPAASLLVALSALGPAEGNIGVSLRETKNDDAVIDPETIWTQKGATAPSAMDLRRRPAVLDAMGVHRQLIFPTFAGILGATMATGGIDRVIVEMGAVMEGNQDFGIDVPSLGRELCTGHNDWCIRVAAIDERLRPVAVLDTSSIEGALAEAKRVIDGGVRAVVIPSDTPPGGRSPAHEDVDQLWRLLSDANVAVCLHLAFEFGFMAHWHEWRAGVPMFESSEGLREADLNPYHFSTVHLAAQNFLTTMILGGVFERHPELRFGVIELTSHWVGPMVENLTMWLDQFASKRAKYLPLSPADYMKRNVRVSSFYPEPVDKYIERHGLEDVYCYSSDFPHVEGGSMNTIDLFAKRLERLGPSVAEKYFVTNAQLLLP